MNRGFAMSLRDDDASGRVQGRRRRGIQRPQHPLQRLAQFARAGSGEIGRVLHPRRDPRHAVHGLAEVLAAHRPSRALGILRGRALTPLAERRAHRVERQVHDDVGLDGGAHPRPRHEDELLDLLRRQRPRLEEHAGVLDAADPVDAERAPVLALEIPAEQVPVPIRGREGVRLHAPARDLAGRRRVGEAHALVIAAGEREFAQDFGGDRFAGADAGRLHRIGERGDPAAQGSGQHLLELGERGQRRLGTADEPLGGGHAQADRHGDGLLIGQQQRGHRAAGLEPVAARDARSRLDAVAEVAQPLDVAAHGALRDAEPRRQLGARPVAVRLQQVQERQRARRRIGHASSMPQIADGCCPRYAVGRLSALASSGRCSTSRSNA